MIEGLFITYWIGLCISAICLPISDPSSLDEFLSVTVFWPIHAGKALWQAFLHAVKA